MTTSKPAAWEKLSKPDGDWILPHFSLSWNTLRQETICTTLGHGPDAGTFMLPRK